MTMATPDHMAGINAAVPKWDRQNPQSYSYDPSNYSASDYAEFKAARLAAQTKRQAEVAKRSKETSDQNTKFLKDFLKGEKGKHGTKATSLDQIKKAVANGATLRASQNSDCFASVSFTNGVCTLEFYRGGQIEYDVPMSLSEYLEFANAPEGLGEYFNSQIR